jgi:hypothetical protein
MTTYICYYRGKQVEVTARSRRDAQFKASELLRVKRFTDIHVEEQRESDYLLQM